jgi:hypothetical protein
MLVGVVCFLPSEYVVELTDVFGGVDVLAKDADVVRSDSVLGVDWKSFDLLSVFTDAFSGIELFNLPPLIVDFVEVLDRFDAYVKVGVQTWLYLWDKASITDFTIPWDICRVKELVVAIGWILRDYPLTDWELERNSRIVNYLSKHKMFRLSDFQRSVWFEQVGMQEQRGFGGYEKQMLYYRSQYIKNFCNFLFSVLEEKGFVEKAGGDSFVVLEVPSLEFINEVARRRVYDIWSF